MSRVNLMSSVTVPRPRTASARLGVLLAMICLVSGASLAQDWSEDPDERFESLLNEGVPLDEATDMVAEDFGEAVAYEYAVDLCAPVPELECKDSLVLEAWNEFLARIEESEGINGVVQDMLDNYFDEYLVKGIALWWCSPTPGDRCGTDPYTEVWPRVDALTERTDPAEAIRQISTSTGPVIAELIGAILCGEPTCFASELAKLDAEDLAELEQLEQPRAEATVKQRATPSVQFQNTAGRPEKSWRQILLRIFGKSQ